MSKHTTGDWIQNIRIAALLLALRALRAQL